MAGGVHIWGKPSNLAKMTAGKKGIFCVIPLSGSLHCRPEFSCASIAQMHSRCYTFKTELLPGYKLSELVVSMGVSVQHTRVMVS